MNFAYSALTPGQTVWALSPELVLLVTGLLILGLDAIHPQREEKRWLPYLALVGLAAAFIAAVTLWGCNTRVLAVLSCDAFSLMVKMVALVAVGLVVLLSEVYIRKHCALHQGEFYALLLFCTIPICLLGGATNLVLIFLAFDFLSITSYVLTGYLRDDPRSAEAGLKYFLYGAAISAVMLYGLSWIYGLSGSVDLGEIATALQKADESLQRLLLPALAFVIAGFAFKIAAFPFHQWAPDAYEGAPTPVTAFISVGPKVAGFAVIIRVLLVAFPPHGMVELAGNWRVALMAISILTMTFGNLVALWQSNIKRLLAYSSIAHAGYVLIGVVVASTQGIVAVLMYLAAYAFTNLGAFASVIAFSNQTGSDEIEDYAGLHKRAPALALALIICLLSLIGIPLTGGFVGKLLLFSSAIEEGLLALAVIGVLNSVISVSYYWKIMRAMYLDPPKVEDHVTISPALGVSLCIAVAGIFVLGVFPNLLLPLLDAAAKVFF